MNSATKLAGGMCAVWFLCGAFALAGDSHAGAYLGVHISNLTPEQAASLRANDGGVLVLSIDQDGPACRAGMKANDVITAVDGKKVQNSEQLAAMMQTMSGGQTANLAILRNGTAQDIKVKLGSRHEWMSSKWPPPPVANSMMAGPTPAPMAMPPMPSPPDPEVPLFTPASARRGVVVEAMTAQLADFFGVPPGQGVLVRNVQKGSLASSSGLKAGDVIVKVNGEIIRDLADWRRSMHSATGKTTFSIIRDKREQAVSMNIPGPASGLRLDERDWDGFEKDLDAFNEQMEQLGPEFEQQNEEAFLLDQDELAKMQRDIERSMRKMDPQLKQQVRDIEKQTREVQKQMQKLEPQMKKQAEEIQKQMEQMRPEIEKQIAEAQKAMTLSQADMQKMRHDVEESMKTITPQIQQQMQELQKEMEQHKHDFDEMMKDWPQPERPNEF
jgi:hypothetical protein